MKALIGYVACAVIGLALLGGVACVLWMLAALRGDGQQVDPTDEPDDHLPEDLEAPDDLSALDAAGPAPVEASAGERQLVVEVQYAQNVMRDVERVWAGDSDDGLIRTCRRCAVRPTTTMGHFCEPCQHWLTVYGPEATA